MDDDFIKLYKLGQYTIEYLLHCQEYLSHGTVELEAKLREAMRVSTVRSIEQSYHARVLTFRSIYS